MTAHHTPSRSGHTGPVLLVSAAELTRLCARGGTKRMTLAYAELTPGMLERLRPRAVAFALLARGQDAFQVLGRLERLGYRGRVLALAPPLPARRMVERELRAQARGLRVRVVCLAALED